MAFTKTSFDGHRVDGIEYIATGAGAIAEEIALDTDLYLEEVRLHLSDVVTTDEDFTIDLDSDNGTAYDMNLLTVDMGQDADGVPDVVTDVVWRPIRPIRITKDNNIDFAFPNTETRTWGLTVVLRKGRK